MDKQRTRRRTIVAFIFGALAAGAVVALCVVAGRPEAVRQFWASATLDAQGNAVVHESIEYRFPKKRHGIYRVLPDVPFADGSQVRVTSDVSAMTAVLPEGNGIRVRIGDPNVQVSGNHHYDITYPLRTLSLGGGRFGWNGVGTSWDVPIERSELDLVAPWKWEAPSCVAGASGSIDPCTVSQPEPGHLVVSSGRSKPGQGVTIFAQRGAPLATAPTPRTPVLLETHVPWWQAPITLGALSAALLLVCALGCAKWLRYLGRDWVMAGAASTGDAAGVAFVAPGDPKADIPAGAMRVDDTKLASWATTEFAPPRGISAWQGGVVAAEQSGSDHWVAWLLGTAIDGYIDLDDRNPKSVVISPRPHDPDATTVMLSTAFSGRSSITLGKYDPPFTALWRSLPSVQNQWLRASGLTDLAAERRVTGTRVVGALVSALAVAMLIVGAMNVAGHAVLGVVGVVAGAVLAGLGFAGVLRAGELHVRTPAGSATWLRIESFRRFIATSEAHHVEEAAQRGVLREYTAWAVALGEVDHWSKMVKAASLPPDTVGLHSALIAPTISHAFASTGSPPSSSGGGGGGVGGGGGGGGGGSW